MGAFAQLGDRPYAWPSQAARILGRSAASVRHAVRAGTIPSRRIGLKDMIPAAWLAEQAERGTRDAP